LLAALALAVALRALCEAAQQNRSVHVRLRSGRFAVSVRRERNRHVSLTLGGGSRAALTWPRLELSDAALPILRLASELVRKLIAVDRRQSHNLRVIALRGEVRTLRRMLRARSQRDSFENADPERLRLPHSTAHSASRGTQEPRRSLPIGLRYNERWSTEIDGLDASRLFLCGDRIIAATQKLLVALSRKDGRLLWSQPNAGALAMQAGAALLRLLPSGHLELHDVSNGTVYARGETAARSADPRVVFVGGPSSPPTAILTETREQLVAIDLRTGQPRYRFRAVDGDGLHFARAGRVLCVTSGGGSVDALDVTSGEVVWRFSDTVRFAFTPAVCRDVVVAAAREPRFGGGIVYGIDLYTGRLLWQRELPEAPNSDPIDAGESVLIAYGRPRQGRLLAVDPRDGVPRFSEADPGVGSGDQTPVLDHSLIVNSRSGRIAAIDLRTGQTEWSRMLSSPLTDDVPRQQRPVLRQGALFVPAAQVHVLRPSDGSSIGQVACDLVPDWLRVDEHGICYIAEESGHLCAYAPGPHLTLVR
jgi:outer membrane protein assembly factor BamB